jgi:hypothetical protein
MFIRVDFPEPDGPMTATSSLAPIARSRPRRAQTVSAAMRYSLVIPSRRMIGSAGGMAALHWRFGAVLFAPERLYLRSMSAPG